MPSPGGAAAPRLTIEDSHLELLADTLESLDLPARGQFLQRYFLTTTHLELPESQCLQLWEEALNSRRQFSEHLGRPVSLKTALMEALSTAGLIRVPVIIEYDELKKMQLNAVTDALTGLYNRRLFNESLEKEMTRAKRYEHPVTLVILDLHRFKEVNDMHGHPKGDEVLRAAAATLRKAMRSSDSAFRIGGDEFALILPQTDAAQALALSRRIETVFAEVIRPLQLTVSVSMDHGIATCPQDGDQGEALIRVADERLYRLKDANHLRGATPGARSEAAQAAAQPAAAVPERPAPERIAPAPKTISIESKKTAEKAEAPYTTGSPVPGVAAAGVSGAGPGAAAPAFSYSMQRKGERVTMAGTNAYAVLGEQGGRHARVLDLGFGGVALELDSPEELPPNVFAILHVPILPPVRVNLRAVWSARSPQGSVRVGCCFVS